MRGTKKHKIVKCFRHFGAIIILLWLISIVRFPYSFDKLQVLSNKNFESVSNSVLTLVDCKSIESKSSIDFLLTDGKQYYIITAKRFFIWNRYDLSQLMPFSEETSYSYTDCFTKVNVVQSGNTLCLYEEGYVQPYILSFLFLCVVLMLNILGDIRDNRHYYEVHMSSQVFDSYYYYTYHTFQIKPSGNSEWWTHNVTHQSADHKTIVADSMNYSYPVGSEPKNPTVSVKASFSIKNYGSFTLKAVTLSRPESL